MKVGVIGAGRVGSACALALVMRGVAREVVLVDRTRARAKAVATDIRYGAPLSESTDICDGDYADLAGVAVAMITSGVNEKSGGATDRNDPVGRLRLLDKNAELYRELLPRILAAAPEAVLLVVTDPPDPLADLARVLAKHDRVLSTGTWVDSLRFQRYANIAIIEGSEASQYGIGMVSARMAEVELFDEREVLPVGSYSRRFGVTLSLPSVLESSGVREIFQPEHSITIRPAARRPLPAGSGELARDTAAEDRPGPIEARARSTVTLSRLR